LNLEPATELIADEELVEVTPKSLRLRKKVLPAKKRKTSALATVEES
jgi:GTP-binding protein